MSAASTAPAALANSEHEALRAQQWGLISALLVSPPDREMIEGLKGLTGDDTALGQAYTVLAKTAARTTPEAIASEFFEVFVGVGRGELLPYASFYLTGFLNERPLADLRRDLQLMGVERAAGRFEPEDHMASLAEVMAGLATGAFDARVLGCGAAGEAGFFARHVQPWAAQFFDDLAVAPSANFYRALAEVGRVFIDIETRAFALEAAAHRGTGARGL